MSGKSGYYAGDSPPAVADLCEQTDERLFGSIKHTHSTPGFVDCNHRSIVHNTSPVPVYIRASMKNNHQHWLV